jgi:hypothetical protein
MGSANAASPTRDQLGESVAASASTGWERGFMDHAARIGGLKRLIAELESAR